MDITNASFDGNLLPILEAISESLFVAVDLEFSGIPDRLAANRSKQSVEERYQELRGAARKFQTLQVGLTCCSVEIVDCTGGEMGFDQENASSPGSFRGPSVPNQKYVLRSYNFTLNPYIETGLDITRQYVCDAAAMDFLVRNGFNITKSYQSGLKYLSPVEERVAKAKFKQRLHRTYDDIAIAEDDADTKEFLSRVRARIDEWREDDGGEDRVMITGRHAVQREAVPPGRAEIDGDDFDHVVELTNLDKRLIHQLVRNEYPDFVSVGRADHMVIKAVDPMREAAKQQAMRKGFQRDVLRQRGFSWVIRALLGHDLRGLELKTFARDAVTGEPRVYLSGSLQDRFDRVQHWLATRRPVLVGHNMLIDLVYLYQHFIDELPDTLNEFASIIHDLFPMIVDTKFLATHDCGNAMPQSGLKEIGESLRWMTEPLIEMASGFTKYEDKEVSHEAGYDSMLTACVMVRLAAQLGKTFGTEESPKGSDSLFNPAGADQTDSIDGDEYPLTVPLFNDEDFWSRFGNKLRTFGTMEKVVDLSLAAPRSNGSDGEEAEIQW